MLETQEPIQIRVSNENDDPAERALLEARGRKALLMLPLITGGETIGMMEVVDDADREFDAADVDFCQALCNVVAAAVQNAMLYQEMKELAARDKLTGLYNRRLFEEQFDAAVARSQRNGEELSLLVVDLDGLKRINDLGGHPSGDEALRALADSLVESCPRRRCPLSARRRRVRVILPGANTDAAIKVAERAQEALNRRGPYSFSGGVARAAINLGSSYDLYRSADIAAYRAKAAGGARTLLGVESRASSSLGLSVRPRCALRSVSGHGRFSCGASQLCSWRRRWASSFSSRPARGRARPPDRARLLAEPGRDPPGQDAHRPKDGLRGAAPGRHGDDDESGRERLSRGDWANIRSNTGKQAFPDEHAVQAERRSLRAGDGLLLGHPGPEVHPEPRLRQARRPVNKEPQDVRINQLGIDNSYSWDKHDVLRFGKGGVDDAEDAEVILHEYGHAIQDRRARRLRNLGGGRRDRRGLRGLLGGDGVERVRADAGPGVHRRLGLDLVHAPVPHRLRRVDEDLHYPADLEGEVHADGQIWSRALWDIRGALGHVKADTLILERSCVAPDTSMRTRPGRPWQLRGLYGNGAANTVRGDSRIAGILSEATRGAARRRRRAVRPAPRSSPR